MTSQLFFRETRVEMMYNITVNHERPIKGASSSALLEEKD